VTQPVKPLAPLTSALELKEATVRDYARNARRMGLEPNVAELERLAIADLTMVDAAKREARPGKKRAPRPRDRSALAKAQEDTGARVVAPSAARARPDVLYAEAQAVGERWGFAVGRLKRILEGSTRATTLEAGLGDATIPKLAREYFVLWGWFLVRHQKHDKNPFLGLSDRDAARKFIRGVEDICDKSSAQMGPWWVPK
jgi:hypothetical protein